MMLFVDCVDRLSEIGARAGRIETTRLLADLFSVASADEARMIAYLLSGQIRPQYKGQTLFGFAERSLRPVMEEFLVAVGAAEAAAVEVAMRGHDIADYIERQSWTYAEQQGISVAMVYERLTDLAALSGTGSHKQRVELLVDLCARLRPVDVAFIIKIILGKLRLGCADMTVLDALSWLHTNDTSQRAILENAYNIHADIGDIVYRVKRYGIAGVADIAVTVGVPIRPAAAERLTSAEAIIDRLGSCIVQPKLDGFRLQMHVEPGSQLYFFSRNLQRMDGMFPELCGIASAMQDAMIIDGEAIAYDEETDRYLPFQETVKRRRKHGITQVAEEYPLRYIAFDLLYYGTRGSCLALPYHERYALLQGSIAALPEQARAVMRCIDEIVVSDAPALHSYFMAQVADGFEGIVAKRQDAPYQAGKRNFNWIKLKRQQIGALQDTIDAVVVGYYYGRGKRARLGIGACLVAVLDPSTDTFMTIAKIGTGFSDADWMLLKEHADRYRTDTMPDQVRAPELLSPDVWVVPHIVVEVAADEITRSPVHTAARSDVDGYGLALRFPRALGIRADKGPADATTVAEVQALFQAQMQHTVD